MLNFLQQNTEFEAAQEHNTPIFQLLELSVYLKSPPIAQEEMILKT